MNKKTLLKRLTCFILSQKWNQLLFFLPSKPQFNPKYIAHRSMLMISQTKCQSITISDQKCDCGITDELYVLQNLILNAAPAPGVDNLNSIWIAKDVW